MYAGFVIDEQRKVIVNQESYHEFPYIIAKFYQNSGEIYGTCTLWTLMAEIKSMDRICDLSRYAAEFAIMPPIKVASRLTIPETGIMPGGRLYEVMDPLMLGSGIKSR